MRFVGNCCDGLCLRFVLIDCREHVSALSHADRFGSTFDLLFGIRERVRNLNGVHNQRLRCSQLSSPMPAPNMRTGSYSTTGPTTGGQQDRDAIDLVITLYSSTVRCSLIAFTPFAVRRQVAQAERDRADSRA